MTRGFITIATGNLHYYKIAANLLESYKCFSQVHYPFAIICEEQNKYTRLFDDVILTSESTHSFMDKFLLLRLCPYDETIFFDADSLAYGDINAYWDYFKGATDFSAPGSNVPVESKSGAWYDVEDIGEYGKRIEYKVRVHAGVCFIRKSENTLKLYQDCMDLYENYDKLRFHTCANSKDECILGVAMPMNKMKAVRENPHLLAAYPTLTYIEADILTGVLRYKAPWTELIDDGIFLHWGTAQTYKPLYMYNAACLKWLRKGKHTVFGSIRPNKTLLLAYFNTVVFFRRVSARLKLFKKGK